MVESTTPKKARKPRKPRAPRTKKKTVEQQIAETDELPIVAETSNGKFARGVAAGVIMLAGLNYGVQKFPEYVPDMSKLTLVSTEEATQKPAEAPQKATEAETKAEATIELPEQKPTPEASVGGVYQDVVILKIGDKEEVRTGGSVSWRYNNPGLIYYGDYAKESGAIGTDGRYALFRTYEDGRNALLKLLFESDRGYKNKSLEDAMRSYAPKNEGFNTEYYIKVIKKDTGIPLTKKMSDFTDKDKNTLLSTLEKIERFTAGKVEMK